MNIRTITAIVLLFSVTGAYAESEESKGLSEVPPTQISALPIDQLPPGARALGLGGAFTAVADDATAALANPAGLANLSAPEVSLFVRNTDADVPFLDPDAFNSGVNALVGQTNKLYADSSTDLSFASFVIPMESFVFSGFYSNQLNFGSAQTAEDVYFDDYFLDKYTNFNSLDGKLENYGLSVAYRFTDRFSAGVTVRNARLKLRGVDSWRLDWYHDVELFIAELVYGAGATVEQEMLALEAVNDSHVYSATLDGSDSDLAYDLGLYYKGDQWSFGFTYHDGAKFNFDTTGSVASDISCNASAEADLYNACGIYIEALSSEDGLIDTIWPNLEEGGQQQPKLPSIISAGVAWRPTDTWLISFDANHNSYSDLTPPRNITYGFIVTENADGTGDLVPLDINNPAHRAQFFDPSVQAIQGSVTEPIKDEMTYHLGVEKSFVFDSGVLRTLALRGGAFTIADHDGVVATDYDETVWTVGLGTTWGKNELGANVFQVDLGASFADDVTNVVLSGIMRF